MLLSGFTFIRNAKKYDFPIAECVQSMLAVVEELVINVGKSDDGTEELMTALAKAHPKIKLIHSVWDDSLVKDGLILSQQTNLALAACSGKWCLYLQADEALHEKELAEIQSAVIREERSPEPVDGLEFRYLHFYGGYTFVQRAWNWYPKEIRIVRKASGAQSFGDAQTFRLADGSPLKTRLIDAHIFHYGHARDPKLMKKKIQYFHRFWHGDQHEKKTDEAYSLDYKNLVWFWSTHPNAYFDRVKAGLEWSPRPSSVAREFKKVVIVSSPTTQTLAHETRRLLSMRGVNESSIHIVTGFRSWVKNVMTSIFTTEPSALIDLAAEEHNPFWTLHFFSDIMMGFSLRVAHAPKGLLPPWRAWFYHYVSWGEHEVVRTKKTHDGFYVPEMQYARQIVRWLGLDG